jgi:hypothetical protein
LRIACSADCGHGDPVVGENRTTGRGTPSCVLLPRTNGSSGFDLWGIEGALFAVAAFVCSAFFLYDPIYSFHVSDMHALGELFWFLIIALVGVKCVAELRRRSDSF